VALRSQKTPWPKRAEQYGDCNHIHTKEKRGIKAEGREVIGADDSYALRGSSIAYKAILWQGNDNVRPLNGYQWNDTDGMSAT
jgi:hypothetical protein